MDNLVYAGTLNLSYEDPIYYSLTIPMVGHTSCLTLTQQPYFSAFADGPKDAQTQSITFLNRCPATSVKLTAAPSVMNLLPDGGPLSDGPFQVGPGAPTAGSVVAPGGSLDVPVVYAPTENGSVTNSWDPGSLALATDEQHDSPTLVQFWGQGYGPTYYFNNYLDFTSAWGTTTTRSTNVGNYGPDYPSHSPTVLGVSTDCPGMSAALNVGLPAPMSSGQVYSLDATWTVPSCDGGECGCDGGWCNCTISLQTSDFPPPHQTCTVYY
jgi:hypothetical protein